MKNVLKLELIITPNLLSLVLQTVSRNPSNTNIEFVHYVLNIVNVCINNQILRNVILEKQFP